MEAFIQDNIELKVNITEGHRLGPPTWLIKMNNKIEKEEIMIRKNKLREYRDARIYINDDKTQKERAIEKEIRKVAAEAKN